MSDYYSYTKDQTLQRILLLDMSSGQKHEMVLDMAENSHYWVHSWDGESKVLLSYLHQNGQTQVGSNRTIIYMIDIKKKSILDQFEVEYINPSYYKNIKESTFFGHSYVSLEHDHKLCLYDFNKKSVTTLVEEILNVSFNKKGNVIITHNQIGICRKNYIKIWDFDLGCSADDSALSTIALRKN